MIVYKKMKRPDNVVVDVKIQDVKKYLDKGWEIVEKKNNKISISHTGVSLSYDADNEEIDTELLRMGISAELEAINLYEQLSGMTKNKKVKKVINDIIREEKTHVGEFQKLLLMFDKEQAKELKKGYEEVKDILR